jgi:hypothetical protein
MPCDSKCCVRQHGVQCRGIDNHPGESCLWQASWRDQCLSRGGFEEVLTVKFRQPSHEFTFGVGMSFISYPLVLTPSVQQVRLCMSVLEFSVYAGF